MVHQPTAPTAAYDTEAVQQPLGADAAADALVAWVEFAYKLLAATDPESIHRLGQHWLGKERYELDEALKDRPQWHELENHPLLQRWIFSASHDARIQKIYGVSKAVGDAAWSALQTEAYDFLNWALATHGFSAASVYPSVVGFWNDLARGHESYEFGEIVYSLNFHAPTAVIALGQDMRLCRLTPEWCAERFEFYEEEPTSQELETRWAVAVTQSRRRLPRPTSHQTQETEADHIQAALLALRLVRFDSFFTAGRYHVGGKGWYKPQTRGLVFPEFWREESFGASGSMWSNQEVSDLIDLGRRIRGITTAAELTQREQSNSLKVALRSYNGSFTRRDWQDRIVDLTVVLEALASRSPGEVSYRVALGCALLIGIGWRHSDRVFRAVTSLYRLRSAIVHGTAGELHSSTEDLVDTWSLTKKPRGATQRRAAAVAIALTLAQQVIVAALRLTTDEDFDPRKDFPGVLNRAALDPDWREKLRIRAGVMPELITHFVAPRIGAPLPAKRPTAEPDE